MSEAAAPALPAWRRRGLRRRSALAAAFAASLALHFAVLRLLPAVEDAPPPAVAPPLEVVLVQPPIPVAAAPPTPERAPRREPALAAKKQPRRAVTPAPATPPAPLTVPQAETPVAAAPTLPEAAPPAPAVTGALRPEPAPAPASPAPAPRPAPLTPPSFNAAYLRNPPPRYPLIARRNGEQGTVTLRVRVMKDGLPGDVTLEKTSGSPALDAAALATVKAWRFVPARQNGQPVDATVLVPIVFRLQDAS